MNHGDRNRGSILYAPSSSQPLGTLLKHEPRGQELWPTFVHRFKLSATGDAPSARNKPRKINKYRKAGHQPQFLSPWLTLAHFCLPSTTRPPGTLLKQATNPGKSTNIENQAIGHGSCPRGSPVAHPWSKIVFNKNQICAIVVCGVLYLLVPMRDPLCRGSSNHTEEICPIKI